MQLEGPHTRRAQAVAAPWLGGGEIVKLALPLTILCFAVWMLFLGDQRTHDPPRLHEPVADLSYASASAVRR